MKPLIPLTDPRFVYRDSHHTDLKATFARLAREKNDREARERAGIVTLPNRRKA